MTGRGSIRHNNRSFSAANVDRSRSGQNVIFCNEDLKKVYHELFDEALADYNAKKKKTRDKIPDYYEHIRQSKQEKLFHEAIFQIGNLTDCGCGSPGGERAAAALKEFAESFQERNPHLRVFNMVLHMDEATPHLHVDFVPVATEQSRGLSTRVSMKQALKQQGFEGLGRKQTEWKAWMEREKEALTEIAQAHEFEIISLGGGRPHMELPEYRAAAQRLEAIQEQVIAAEQEIAALEKQRKALQGNVKLLKAVEKVKPDLDAIQPEKTLTGAVKGVTVEQVKELKAAVPANWWFAPSSSLTSWPSRTPSRWLSAIWWIPPPPWSMPQATMWYPSSCPAMWTVRIGCKRSCTARRRREYVKKAAADAKRPPLPFWGRERHGDVWFIHGSPLRSTARPSRRGQTRFSLSLPSPGLFGDLIICLTYK